MFNVIDGFLIGTDPHQSIFANSHGTPFELYHTDEQSKVRYCFTSWGVLKMLGSKPIRYIPPLSSRPVAHTPVHARKSVQILLVEDNIPVRAAIEQVLTHAQYRIVSAKTGEEALRWLHRGSFDLLLTDYKLPGIDGAELTRQAKARDPGMPVLVISGVPDPGLELSAIGAGACLFLRKPIGAQELQATVAAILEKERKSK